MGSYLGIPRRRKKVLCKLRCLMPVTVFTNSAGFLIRCMRLFDAIREELVPYGTQTFPSVASASLCLIKRNLRRYSFNTVIWYYAAGNTCSKFLFQSEGWLYNSHPPRIGSPAAAGSIPVLGNVVQSTAFP